MNDSEIEIILIEDNPNDAELITRALRKNNLTNKITLLKDGAEAMEFLFPREESASNAILAYPKVILLDLKLPKVSGAEILRRIKSDDRTKMIPIVVLTSSNQELDIKIAYDLGVNSYVTKPIRFGEFAKVVADLGVYWLMHNKPPGR